jgi:hypothetical protein
MKSQSPFLEVSSFLVKEIEEEAPRYELFTNGNSPFLTLYESPTDGTLINPETEAYVTFLNELYDEEFDESLANLIDEAGDIYQNQFAYEHSDPQTVGYQAERVLQQHFAPLVGEWETLLETMSRELGQRHVQSLSEAEIDTMVESYQPSAAFSPNFEQFWGGLKKFVKKSVSLAKKGVGALAKLGFGPILNKLKALAKPLIKRVIEMAIGKLPEKLQPWARKLAGRLPFLKEMEESDGIAGEANRGYSESDIQSEFHQQIANLLFAHNEVEMEMEVARAVSEPRTPDRYPLAELEDARAQFIDRLQHLKEGEDPTPYVENFLPALLPVLKTGITLIGRKRVVNFLAKFVAKLIRKFINPQVASALSQAMVDVGLRVLQLETSPEEEARSAASAVATTVEETMRRVADLPEYVLDNQELLEGFTLEAFEQAAAANLPPSLSAETYRKRPDLALARNHRGIWLMRPGRGRRRYKLFSRRLPIRITPHKVAEVESFDGASLAEHLEEQLGIAPGEEVEPILHLFEAVPGTRLADIARQEEHIPGLGAAARADQLHPLTPQAATLLLGEPSMGREMAIHQPSNAHTTVPGERFYYLEVPGKRPLTATEPTGKSKMRRRTTMRLILDFPKNEMRAYLFLSEVRAQEIAVKLRQNAHPGTVMTRLGVILERRLTRLLSGKSQRLKLVQETVTPEQWFGALKQFPSFLAPLLVGRFKEWMMKSLADYLKQQSREFILAAENTADGVTLVITISNPPGFTQVRQALKGNIAALAGLKLSQGAPSVKIKAYAGYHHE